MTSNQNKHKKTAKMLEQQCIIKNGKHQTPQTANTGDRKN